MTVEDERLRRTVLAILAALLALPVVAFAALCIWAKATEGEPPAMFADVPWDFRDDGPWTARMAAIFPAGTPEPVLVLRLRAEGFEVDPVARSAQYGWNDFICAHTVEARWSARDGRVATSSARYMNACP